MSVQMDALMRDYDLHAKQLEAAGFTREHVQNIGDEALLMFWDMYIIFQEVKKIPDGGTYLEIGSHLGGSLRCAWEAAGDRIDYIAIEPHVYALRYGLEFRKKFHKNTSHIPKERFTHFEEYSESVAKEIADNSVDVLLVDGNHDYGPVKRDLLLYWPKIKPGGVLLAHDFNYSPDHQGVVRAVIEVFVFQEILRPYRSNLAMVRKEAGSEGLYVVGETYGIAP